MSSIEIINTAKWLQENADCFKPPVCNKLMHNEQLTVMFVGGANQREDYHIELGEEMFYQVKGDMSVKIIENGQHREVFIKEGEVFILPARIPHSPQRPINTLGLVVERKRSEDEIDGVRWFVPGSSETLYEKWFHCTDLGVQLAPVIKDFFASEEYTTKKPCNNVLPKTPYQLNNSVLDVERHGPFNLKKRIEESLRGVSKVSLTPEDMKMQFSIEVLGTGEHFVDAEALKRLDVWLWQFEGESDVSLDEKNEFKLKQNDSVLVQNEKANEVKIQVCSGCLLKIAQDPSLKSFK